MSLSEAFMAAIFLGIAGSTHCLGMCGAISMSITFSLPESERGPSRLIYWHLWINAGRVSFYTLLGAISGYLGHALARLVPGGGQVVLLVSALVLLMISMQLAGQARGILWLESIGQGVWRRIAPVTRPLLPLRHAWQAYALGVLWGFMPCGLIYTALTLAAGTTSPLGGALLMAFFGVITAVPVASTGVLAGSINWMRQRWWKYVCAALCFVLAASLAAQALIGDPHAHHQHMAPVSAGSSGAAAEHHH
ncbi:MAG: sulfite exporter TauE/SafE family protein [Alcanivoracaceae bacterium]|nr:sulfite exporter TauE/SafE family protein [Alcanivoracaceae bacterium]